MLFNLRGYLCVFWGVLALLSSYCLNMFYMFISDIKNLLAIFWFQTENNLFLTGSDLILCVFM